LPGAEGEEAGRKKETMELFPQSAGLDGVQDAATADGYSASGKHQWFRYDHYYAHLQLV
jgi:hypothetical protein